MLLSRVSAGLVDGGGWTVPGGGLDFGEQPADGALRELTEETGLTGRIDSLVAVDSVKFGVEETHDGSEFSWMRIFYRVTVTGGELCDEVNGSTDACGWFGIDEIRAMPLVELTTFALPLVFPG